MKNHNVYWVSLHKLVYYTAAQLILPIGMGMNAIASDYFNPELLGLGAPTSTPVDLSAFEKAGGQIPGTYRVDIYVNNDEKETNDIKFIMLPTEDGKDSLQPCLTVDKLAAWGVLTKNFSQLSLPNSSCANLSAIPQASVDYRFHRQQLLLSFPQSAMNNAARGWIDPMQWDEGISAVLLNYSVSGANNYTRSAHGYNNNSQFVNLRPGANIGAWRLRNYTTWSRTSSSGKNGQSLDSWNTIYTYAQRDIPTLKSQLILGDSTSPPNVFDSIPFRGGQLASDDDMLPESLRGYAPVVRGIARSNAQVTIRQNGYVIYQTYVSPGSFEISDMYPTGGAGDLNVTIKEADGSEQQLVIPYASLPILQREDKIKYAVTTGVYRAYDSRVDKAPLTQGTVIYGLPAGYTLYGGGQFSHHYQSMAFGFGKNLGDLGALSLDVTQAWSQQKDQVRENGQSLRGRYSKNLVATGTNFSIAGYRYATDGYWSMQEVLETYREGLSYPMRERRRNRAEITMTQTLGKATGNLSLSGMREDYWNSNRRMESVGIGYNNSVKSVSYSLNYTYTRNLVGTSMNSNNGLGRVYDTDQLFSLNLSIPLNTLFDHPTWASYSMNSSKNGNTNYNMSLGGTALDDNNLSWSLQQGYGNHNQGNSGSVNTNWRSTYGELNSSYGYDRYTQRLNYGVQGGIIVHEDGITISQPLGETVALVAAPGANNVSVVGQTGVRTDFRGYGVVPYLTPYRKNNVTLNPETLEDNAAIELTTQTVIPTRGAVVKASYQTSVGHKVLMILTQKNGQSVPFGATVFDMTNKDNQKFIVGDNGQVYLTGLADSGSLNVQWGMGDEKQCKVTYQLAAKQSEIGIINANGLCQ